MGYELETEQWEGSSQILSEVGGKRKLPGQNFPQPTSVMNTVWIAHLLCEYGGKKLIRFLFMLQFYTLEIFIVTSGSYTSEEGYMALLI